MYLGRPVRQIVLSFGPARLGIDSGLLKRPTNTGSGLLKGLKISGYLFTEQKIFEEGI
jgi:hypothetical protein